jgi:ubiquinone/menaquinone biosynthesis C-methylase UbiE
MTGDPANLFAQISAYAGVAAQIVPYGTGTAYCVRRTINKLDSYLPLPPVAMRLGYGVKPDGTADDTLYLAQGRAQMDSVLAKLRAAGGDVAPGARVLDFGCSSGRMLRHLRQYADGAEIWGVDLHASMIEWCAQNLSPPFHFATVSSDPHLPFEDRSFDFVYAGSVFTHIAELSDAWFLEIRRVLKPEGFLWASIIDNAAVANAGNSPAMTELGAELRAEAQNLGTTLEECVKLVVRRNRSVQAPQVYFERAHLKAKLSRWFLVADVTDRAYGFQSGYLLQKVPDGAPARPGAADHRKTLVGCST